MPPKKKKLSKKSKKKTSSAKDKPSSLLLKDPIVPEVILPPPLPFETLVGILSENPMSDKEIDGIKVTTHIARKLTAQEIRDLHFVFQLFDVNLDGFLNEEEAVKALRYLQVQCPVDNLRRAFYRAEKSWNHHHNIAPKVEIEGGDDQIPGTAESATSSQDYRRAFKGLNVCQFLDLVISRQGDSYDYMDELKTAFRIFDIDDTGHVTAETLRKLARSVGFELSESTCQEMLSLADRDGDGWVNETEFMKMMLQTNLYSSSLLN